MNAAAVAEDGKNAEHGWDDEQAEALRKLWCDEGLSASACGLRLGKTRSAVISKVHRMGIAKTGNRPPVPQRSADVVRLPKVGAASSDGTEPANEDRPQEEASGGIPIPPVVPPRVPPPIPPQPETEEDEDEETEDEPTINRERKLDLGLPEPVPAKDVTVRVPLRAADGGEGVPIMEAGAFRCKYPLWPDNAPIGQKMVCGCPVRTGKSWCAVHCMQVFEPPNPRRNRL